MTFINLITGLMIAAVLSVPGAMQHEAVQVGEEPVVVKEVVSESWFEYNSSGPVHLASSYTLTSYDDSTIDNLCPEGFSQLCAAKLPPGSNPNHPDQTALDEMQGEISDAIGSGSTNNVRIKN